MNVQPGTADMEIPLTGNTWEQGPEELQELLVEFDYAETGEGYCQGGLNFYVDGSNQHGGYVIGAGPKSGRDTFEVPFVDSGEPRSHEFRVSLRVHCYAEASFKINYIRADVVSTR